VKYNKNIIKLDNYFTELAFGRFEIKWPIKNTNKIIPMNLKKPTTNKPPKILAKRATTSPIAAPMRPMTNPKNPTTIPNTAAPIGIIKNKTKGAIKSNNRIRITSTYG